jgi:hypothetical protein
MNTTETTTFNTLIANNLTRFESIDIDLMDLFKVIYGADEAEELEEHEISDKLDYDGSLHELIDGNIDIYNHDLRKWSVDNYNYIEDAISEGLSDGTDFHKSIQSGQYLKYQEDMNNELSDLSDAIEESIEDESNV